MRETGERAGTAERFLPRNFINEPKKRVPHYSACLGFYSQTSFTNYKNNITNTITMGAN